MTYDITQWLKKQPLWIQATAVYLQSKKTLEENDIAYLAKILKGEISEVPDLSKFQVAKTVTNQVRLQSVGEIKGIDKLNPRKPLDFGTSNFGVVYGRNGSGKSGYARIIKRVCGKSTELLKHNVYMDAPVAQTCSIKFLIDENEQTQVWDAKGDKIDALSVIDIFDGSVGEFYLQQERESTYTPQEMVIFTNLVSVCEKVTLFLETEKTKLVQKLPIPPQNFIMTDIMKQYQGLQYDIKQNAVNVLTIFNIEEEQKINTLRERLSLTDPAAEAKKRREIKRQIENIKTGIETSLLITSKDFIENLQRLLSAATQKRQAVNEGAKVLTDVSKLEGVGQETWKALWEAARTYSTTSAYKGNSFPFIEDKARCVLCHQELSEEAKKRVQSFEEFVQGKLEIDAKTAELELAKALQDLPNVVMEDDIRTRIQAAELEEALGNEVWTFIEKINTLVMQLKNKNIPDTNVMVIHPMQNVLQKLTDFANSAEQKAIQFDADAKMFDQQKTKNELLELEAKQWIAQQKDAVLAEIERLKQVHQYDGWIKETNTRSITIEAGSASEQLITEAYVRRFNIELEKLGATGITVELVKAKNVKGTGKYRIQLRNAKTIDNPAEILSDGEKRIVSLAAFLADVTGRVANVPFVFDDPISSLDQEFEERTIARLVELGRTRQVIVFTHRLSFLSILTDKADDSLATIYIDVKPWGTGEPSEVPIFGKKTKEALNTLKGQRLADLKGKHKEGSDEYDVLAKALCSDFRIIMERIVETVLLADVVQRHRRAVNTIGKLWKLAEIKKEDCDLIDEMMTKYSCYEHSQSHEAPVQIPVPEDLEKDIEKVLAWHNDFSGRTKDK
jgi:energy-coupling factor transporter ATP-binding protein EcfA2